MLNASGPGGFRPARAVVFLVLGALLSGCDGEDDEAATPPVRAEPMAISFEQLSEVPLGTSRSRVERALGAPYRRQETKPSGVAHECYRYRGIAPSGEVDPVNEYRLCYDRRGRLSVKSTAPIR